MIIETNYKTSSFDVIIIGGGYLGYKLSYCSDEAIYDAFTELMVKQYSLDFLENIGFQLNPVKPVSDYSNLEFLEKESIDLLHPKFQATGVIALLKAMISPGLIG